MTMQLRRGTNISHWLSQSDRRGADRRAWFTRNDMRRIADWGFDHVRLPVDEVQLWDDSERARWSDGFDLNGRGAGLGRRGRASGCGLTCTFLRSHFFNQETEPPLISQTRGRRRSLVDFGRQLSGHLRRRDQKFLAYELMNEPVAHEAEAWNRVARIGFDVIPGSGAGANDHTRIQSVVLGRNLRSACRARGQSHHTDLSLLPPHA